VAIVLSLSAADHSVSPPKIHIPRDYNAAYDLRTQICGPAAQAR
jgi:hypothetical protein